ncbi:MAG: hypothetical protein IKL25_11660 [Clostridia bacterium]|nr:hypothetical protein [Clostridia bacterium]
MKKLVSLLLAVMMISAVTIAMAETVTVAPGAELKLVVEIATASGNGVKIGIETNDAPVTFKGAEGMGVNDTVPPKAFNDFFVVVNIEGVEITNSGTDLLGNLTDYTLSPLEAGQIGTLTFLVDKGAEEGTYTVSTYVAKGASTVNSSITFEVKAASGRIPGDVNDDGEVDMIDSVLLDRYLADWDVTINMSNADVNGDGEVDMIDSVMLDRYLADWDIELI